MNTSSASFTPSVFISQRFIYNYYRKISNIIHQITKLKWFVSRLFAQSIEARFLVENEDVVGAAPTGDAPTTSEWLTTLFPTKVCLNLEVWRYIERSTIALKSSVGVGFTTPCCSYNDRAVCSVCKLRNASSRYSAVIAGKGHLNLGIVVVGRWRGPRRLYNIRGQGELELFNRQIKGGTKLPLFCKFHI